jgi:hypothetical protein
LVRVKWDDSTIHAGWSPQVEAKSFGETVFPIVTVGWLLAATKTHLLVAQSVSPYSYGNMLRIPLGCVIEQAILHKEEIVDEAL